jgi:hypothetical protein
MLLLILLNDIVLRIYKKNVIKILSGPIKILDQHGKKAIAEHPDGGGSGSKIFPNLCNPGSDPQPRRAGSSKIVTPFLLSHKQGQHV